MSALTWWLIKFIFNGLLFVAATGSFLAWVIWNFYTVPVGDVDQVAAEEAALVQQEEADTSDLLTEDAPMSGRLIIRRQFAANSSGSGGLFSSSPIITEPVHEPSSSNSSGEENGSSRDRSESSSLHTNVSTGTNATTSTYTSRIQSTYRSVLEAKNSRFPSAPRDNYYCVLKGKVLFIYENESQTNCLAALGVDNYVVSIEKNDGPFAGRDAQMFTKRSSIVLKAKKGEKAVLPALTRGMQAEQGDEREIETKPFYIFVKPNIVMEDWYLALVQASGQATTSDSIFDVRDMKSLVGTIDAEPDPIPMRWFNAMLGRIFYALYQTESLEEYIRAKIIKKTSQLVLPGYVGPIKVKEVNVGNTPPYFSKPMLKELRPDGTTSFEAHLSYRSKSRKPDSQIRITIETFITVPLSFSFTAVLAVVVKSVEGNVLIHMKKPPSNRIWWGFTTMPEIDVEIKPILASKSFHQIGTLTAYIEKQMREAIRDSIVLPNMDDLSIFDTSHLQVRGGVFDEAGKFKRNAEGDREEPPTIEGQPKEELVVSNEDPSSAVPTTSTLRHRHNNRAQSTDLTNIDLRANGTAEVTGLGISRTDTAPPAVGNGASTKTSAAVQATKRWFAQTGSSRPPSLSMQSVAGGLPNDSDPTMIRQRSSSSERPRVLSAEPQPVEANFENDPVIAAVQVSSSTAGHIDSERSSLAPTPSNDSDHSKTPTGGINPHTLSAPRRPSADQASSASRSSLENAGSSTGTPAQAHQSSTSVLMNSLRARDKKALQAQAGAARESLKKWGVGLAAKRRAGRDPTHPQEEHRPPALYRPPEEDAREDDVGLVATSPTGGRSLQDRLNAVAHAAPSPLPIPARERSASSSSKPSLFASPGKSTASTASSSPPNWTPSMSKPTTSVIKNEATPHHPAQMTVPGPASATTSERRGSQSTPVLMQPAPGRSMVVPRVPKRPGQVTGIGHNANEPMVRRVSTEDGMKEERIEKSENEQKIPPVLPPRPSKEGLRSAALADQGGPAALDIPSPAETDGNTQESAVPPPLPSRNKLSPTPSVSGLTASKPASQAEPTPVPEVETFHRSDSVPDSTAGTLIGTSLSSEAGTDLTSTHTSSPNLTAAEIVLNGKDHIQGVHEPPLTPSGAETALRQLVAKNEGVFPTRKARISDGSDTGSTNGHGVEASEITTDGESRLGSGKGEVIEQSV
ncbi:hypothetical protein IAU59_003847 [Kwoniella sp. CBS 9459]